MNKIKEHLTENNMSYFQHLKFAMFFGCLSLLAGCCLIFMLYSPVGFKHLVAIWFGLWLLCSRNVEKLTILDKVVAV